MDALGTYLTSEMIKALGTGNLVGFAAYFLIFGALWWEIRSLKKSVETLIKTINSGFTAGELRFLEIEKVQKKHDLRFTEIETILRGVKT